MTTNRPNTLLHAKEYLLSIFHEKGDAKFLFHSYNRCLEILDLVLDIGRYSGYTELSQESEFARLAAIFHTVGILENYALPIPTGKRAASVFLREQQYPELKIQHVLDCLETIGKNATTPESQLLHDATLAYFASSNYSRLNPLLRLELELKKETKYATIDWESHQLQYLLDNKFYTPYGQKIFIPFLNENILEQKGKVEALEIKQKKGKLTPDQITRNYQGLEPKIPMRGAQTFFRSVYRNHINMVAIADNKANIMTGLNSLLVSVVISIACYGNVVYNHPNTVMPITIFLLTAIASLIFSVLAASPRVTKVNENVKDVLTQRKNIAFFGNFSSMSMEQYEQAMDAMLRDDELLYGNMTRDLYFLGKSLDKKYKLLRISYLTFLVGFIVSVIAFGVMLFPVL